MRIDLEIWKDIAGFDGLYQVSNLGRVRSFRVGGSKQKTVAVPRLLNIRADKVGRKSIDLGQENRVLIARLLYTAFIGPIPATMEVDHKDCNPGNDTLDNLRLCTSQQNSFNRRKPANNTTGYKGVYRRGARFYAQICCKRRQMHLGMFETLEEAAKAYDKAAIQLYREFASLNFQSASLS